MGQQVIEAVDAVAKPSISPGESQDSIDAKLSAYRIQMMEAMCGAIVLHIQTFAIVNSSVAVIAVSGVTTGLGLSGPGTGTGTGTIV